MKKLYLLFISIFMIGINAYSQDLIPNQNDKGKWGYVDSSGTKIIDYQYDEASFFTDGRAKVRKGNNYGFIDENNKIIIPIKYNNIDIYKNNIYKVSTGGNYKDGVLFNEKYGFIDINGIEILKPEYEEIGQFKNGLAYIKKSNLYGYINDSIKIIVPCKYKAIGSFNDEGFVWVNDGCSFDKNNSKKFSGGKFGIYNLHGDLIIPVEYLNIGTFTLNGKYYRSHRILDKLEIDYTIFSKIEMPVNTDFYVSKKSNGTKNGVINKFGEILVPVDKYFEVHGPEEGIAPIRTSSKIGNYYNYYVISSKTLLYKEGVTKTYSFEGDIAVQENNNKNYLVDKLGNCISAKYDIMYRKKSGIYQVAIKINTDDKCELIGFTEIETIIPKSEYKKSTFYSKECGNSGEDYSIIANIHKTKLYSDYRFGLIDSIGNTIIEPKFINASAFSEGLSSVRECGKAFGYINVHGEYVIKPKYDFAYSFHFGYAYVKTKNGWGIIDKTGNEVIPCQYNSLKFITEDNPKTLWVQKEYNGKWICLDFATRKPIFNKEFRDVRNFNLDCEGVAFVKDYVNKIGIIDTLGNEIIPFEIYGVDKVIEAYNKLKESGKKKWEKIDSYRYSIYSTDKRNDYELYDTIKDSLWDY